MINYDLRSARARRQAFALSAAVILGLTLAAAYLHVGSALRAHLVPEVYGPTLPALPWPLLLAASAGLGLLLRTAVLPLYLVLVFHAPTSWLRFDVARRLVGELDGRVGELPGSVRLAAAAAALAVGLALAERWHQLGRLPRTSERHGSARFATLADLRRTVLLSRHGIPLARFGRRWLRDPSPYSVLVLAPTGAGKTTGTLIPAVIDHPGSLVVLDPKDAEIFEKTSGYRQSLGHPVIHLHPEEPVHAINPLDLLPRDRHLVTYSNITASILVNPQGRDLASTEEFWIESARSLVCTSILIALYRVARPHLGTVAMLLHEHDLRGFLQDASLDRQIPDYARRVAAGLVQLDERPFTGIVATARKAVDLYLDPQVLRLLTHSSFDLARLRQEPVSVYITLRPNRAAIYQPLLRLLLTLMLHRLTEREPRPDEQSLLMVIDELPLLRKFTYLETALGFARSYRLRLLLAAQNLQQLHTLYGRDPAILNHCRTQLHYPPTDHASAKLLSDLIGQRTIATDSASRNTSGLRTTHGATANEAARALLAPDEIRRLDPRRPLVLHPGVHPIVGEWAPWFRDRRLRRAVAHGRAHLADLPAIEPPDPPPLALLEPPPGSEVPAFVDDPAAALLGF